MHVIGPIPVMTAAPSLHGAQSRSFGFQIRFHTLKCSIGDVMNKKIADDRLSQWREHRHTKIQVMRDFDQHAGGSFLEGPDDATSLL